MSDEVEIREELGKLNGERRRFKATVGRFGSKSNFKTGFPEKTVLLLNVIDIKTGRCVTGHLWFACRKRFEALTLQENDEVTFDARVSVYRKFHRSEYGNREDNYHYHDYKLSYPTNIKKTLKSTLQEATMLTNIVAGASFKT